VPLKYLHKNHLTFKHALKIRVGEAECDEIDHLVGPQKYDHNLNLASKDRKEISLLSQVYFQTSITVFKNLTQHDSNANDSGTTFARCSTHKQK
jgi:hypothetical protein